MPSANASYYQAHSGLSPPSYRPCRAHKKKEGELIAHLRKGNVSIPKLQFEMKVSYKDARSLIEYATGHKWIKGCTSGNEYPVIVTNFARKDLPADICKKDL